MSVGNGLSQKTEQRTYFDNRTGNRVNDNMLDDKANEVFNKIDGNIVGLYWKAKTQEPAAHTPVKN